MVNITAKLTKEDYHILEQANSFTWVSDLVSKKNPKDWEKTFGIMQRRVDKLVKFGLVEKQDQVNCASTYTLTKGGKFELEYKPGFFKDLLN